MVAPKLNGTRDPFLDIFKGIMILWVIHIHTVYWSGYHYVPDGVRQATLLADVPIFFFISGFLIRPGSFRGLLSRTIRQFVRLYAHYILVSCLLLALLAATGILTSGLAGIDMGLAFDSMFRIIPHGDLWERIPVYAGSLWFIQDYLSMLLFIPLLLGFSRMRGVRYQVLVFILLFTALFPKEYADRVFLFSSYGNVSFYLFFFMLGVIFREYEDALDIQSVVLSLLIASGLALLVFFMGGKVLEIQKYKFPPSMQYLIYSLLLVHVFVLLKKILEAKSYEYKGRISRFLSWCGVNVFTIYLFQGAVCSLPYFFINGLIEVLHPFWLYCFLLLFNILLTLLATYLYRSAQGFISSSRLIPLSVRKFDQKQEQSG